MSLLNTLTREHEVFRDILRRVERSLKCDESIVREELRDAFLVLLPALNKHERIEDWVYGHFPHASPSRTHKLLAEIEAQHREIETLRIQIQEALRDLDRISFEQVKFLALEICEKLRLHFLAEETQLWPNYRLTINGGRESSISRLALSQVKELERNVEQSRVMIADYLGGPK